MSVNGLVASVAIAVTSMGIIARACKLPRVKGTPETSATPNNIVPGNAVSAFSSAEASRNSGTALCAA